MKLSYLQKFAVLTLSLLGLGAGHAMAAPAIAGRVVYAVNSEDWKNNENGSHCCSYSPGEYLSPVTMNGLICYGQERINMNGNNTPLTGQNFYIDLNELTTNQATKPPTGSLSIDKSMVGQDGKVTLQWSVTPSQ